MITWPLCALILGLAFIAALWDGARRFAAARGAQAQVKAALEAHDAAVAKKLADHRDHIDTLKRGTDAYVAQTTAQINALQASLNVRHMSPARAG